MKTVENRDKNEYKCKHANKLSLQIDEKSPFKGIC